MKSTLSTAQNVKIEPECLEPFESIALAFSGGGFRAASFAQGVLSYLNEVPFSNEHDAPSLLNKVTYLSSASGGTIATTLYAQYNGLGKTFEAFYKKLYTELHDDKLLTKALQNLVSTKIWENKVHKQRTIINAFALAYDECLFAGGTMGDILPTNTVTGHLEEVCFNATELFRGLLFRQQIAIKDFHNSRLLFGNYTVHLQHKAACKLKLADVLAASSCFPAGFEPLMFPNDFANNDISIDELKDALEMFPQTTDEAEIEFTAKKTFGLMDGGVTDNQGLESMMQADQRRYAKEVPFKPFSLMLVNDVTSQYLDPYAEPKVTRKTVLNVFTVNSIKVLLVLVALTSAYVCWLLTPKLMETAAVLTFTISVIIGSASLFVFVVLLFLQSVMKGSAGTKSGFNLSKVFSPAIVALIFRFLSKAPLRILTHLIKQRIRSVIMLTSDLFLKRIRYLLYQSFYNTAQWQNRGKGNHVYDLSFTNNYNRQQHPDNPTLPVEYSPSAAIQTVAQVAFTMGTTLWFDVHEQNQCYQQASLIACGQFTTCYNLLEYIWRLQHSVAYNHIPVNYKQRVQTIMQKLEADYKRFKADPFWLYNRLGTQYRLPDFKPVSWQQIHCKGIDNKMESKPVG